MSGVRGLFVLTLCALLLAGCGRRGALEGPPGAVGDLQPISPPAPGSGGPSGPRPFAGPGSSPVDAPAVAVVGVPQTAAATKRPPKPSGPFLLDPLL